ncbi:MAG TPA: sulfatase-like hydrolase/transferase [Phycisphaerae bacterium]|nr:sulfatase-like hydrolase/transferase [Phycisphaerae bacterium]
MISDSILQEQPSGGGDRPNVLLLFSDQHNARMAGFMGDEIVRTPNLDRLADEGAVFETAYCNSPLCSPSRQSFMAGLHCHKIDMWNNTAAMPPDTVTWAHMLSLAGYETSLFGKMHFNGYEKMYGFDRRPVLEGSNDGESFYSWGLRTSHEWTAPLPYTGQGDISQAVLHAGADTPQRCAIFQKDLEVRDGVLADLRAKAADGFDRPWAICAGFVLPHPPYKARADILETYRGTGDVPFNVEGAGRDTCDRYVQMYHGDVMKLPPDVHARAREAYFALVTEIDEHCGMILDCLAETGLAEDTVVVYFSDHGETAGEHGTWGKVTLLEASVRVPLVIRWPGRVPGGRRVAAPVSLVDLYPTFLDIAGIAMPAPLTLDGHSLVPLLDGDDDGFEGGEVFCEFEGEGWNHPRAFLRSGRYKYVYNHTAESRLYDLEADPYEMTDLSGDPAHAKAEAALRRKLLAQWDPADIERRVLAAQARRKIARCKNVCQDLGW